MIDSFIVFWIYIYNPMSNIQEFCMVQLIYVRESEDKAAWSWLWKWKPSSAWDEPWPAAVMSAFSKTTPTEPSPSQLYACLNVSMGQHYCPWPLLCSQKRTKAWVICWYLLMHWPQGHKHLRCICWLNALTLMHHLHLCKARFHKWTHITNFEAAFVKKKKNTPKPCYYLILCKLCSVFQWPRAPLLHDHLARDGRDR